MKKYLLKASVVTGISLAVSTLIVGVAKLIRFKKNHPMKLKDYTKYALYMASLDDEIVRNELGDGVEIDGEEVEVHFPHRMETLKHRYNLFLEMNKGKTEEELIEEIMMMEERLKASRKKEA